MATRKPESRELKEPGIEESGAVPAKPATPSAETSPSATAAGAEAAQPVEAAASIPLRVWVLTCGMKPDQTAGFCHYAKKQKLGPMSAQQWTQAHRDFSLKPV